MTTRNRLSLDAQAASGIITHSPAAIVEVNQFAAKVFRTRGGRIGSGMGGVIEALWGFYMNLVIAREKDSNYELGWIFGHEYNDFACIRKDADWNPSTGAGELFRVEAKSMVHAADESKAHFDRLQHELNANEILAVFLWNWVSDPIANKTVYPAITDHFVGLALPIARLRDDLHLARGGSFVKKGACPDKCSATTCTHVGEPINASGVRERKSGPVKCKGANVSYSANFGGLLRMLGSRGDGGKDILKKYHSADTTAARFIDFMARNFSRVMKSLK
jgi:hypothetical protein